MSQLAIPAPLKAPAPIARAARTVLAKLWKTPITCCYALLLLAADALMALLSAGGQSAVVQAVSTNITHLAVDPLLVLPASALFDMGGGWIWPPLTLLLIGGLERRLGAGRTLAVVFGAHMIATLLSEGLLLVQIGWHFQPRSEINIVDVGPSYVILAALAGCLIIGSWRLRFGALAVGAVIVPDLMTDLPSLDMSSVGHLMALILGASFAGYLASARSRENAAMLRDAAARAAAATRRLGEVPIKERVTA